MARIEWEYGEIWNTFERTSVRNSYGKPKKNNMAFIYVRFESDDIASRPPQYK